MGPVSECMSGLIRRPPAGVKCNDLLAKMEMKAVRPLQSGIFNDLLYTVSEARSKQFFSLLH